MKTLLLKIEQQTDKQLHQPDKEVPQRANPAHKYCNRKAGWTNALRARFYLNTNGDISHKTRRDSMLWLSVKTRPQVPSELHRHRHIVVLLVYCQQDTGSCHATRFWGANWVDRYHQYDVSTLKIYIKSMFTTNVIYLHKMAHEFPRSWFKQGRFTKHHANVRPWLDRLIMTGILAPSLLTPVVTGAIEFMTHSLRNKHPRKPCCWHLHKLRFSDTRSKWWWVHSVASFQRQDAPCLTCAKTTVSDSCDG